MNNSTNWWTKKTKTCTIEECEQILNNNYNEDYENNSYDKVYNNIYISNGQTALNMDIIKQLNITHILNASQGSNESLNLVNTDQQYYKQFGIIFFGIKALDITNFNLMPYFDESANFIHSSLINRGTVLVHCKQGISRSASLVLAYLMIKQRFMLQQAIKIILEKRQIYPNQGFLHQLCVLNDLLFLQQ